mmetsp:Transcript_9837/g.20679  ORF Transcript_9837/g.20679 Transcript_9837/m.20679 type:complete len:1085 (-) Transcript_9837:118-3372(-)
MIDVDRTTADKPRANTASAKTATSKTLSNKTSRSRVSFQLISSDRPAVCTPPQSPAPVDAHDDPDVVQAHTSGVHPSIQIAPSKRDTLPNNTGNNRNSSIRVNTLFCRVPDNDSVISDLSASIIPTGSQFGKANDRQRFTSDNGIPRRGGGKEMSLFSSILNACGTFENMPDFLTNNSIIGTDADESGWPFNAAKKTHTLDDDRFRRPTVWGVAPSRDDDDDEADGDDNEMQFKPEESAEADFHIEHEEEEFDNVELVLDENMMAPPPKPPKQERPPLPNNGRITPTSILRKKVSKVSGAIMNRAQSPKLPNVVPSRSPSPSPVLGNDPRISHTYDIAVFENEELRPSGFGAPAATTVRCVTPTNAESGGGKGEEDAKLVAIADDQEFNKVTCERELPKEKEDTTPSEPSIAEGEAMSNKRSKSTRKFSVVKGLSFSRKKSGKAESPSKNKRHSPPGKALTNSSLTQPSAAPAELKSAVKPKLNSMKKTTEDPKPAPSPKRNRLSGLANSLKPASFANSSPNETSTATATMNTSEGKPQTSDAKHWKATLDKNTNKTYYYHTKTKEVTWEKPPGFDEVQKERDALIAEAKYWKATSDPNTGKTYYYHSKTKEVTWVKPDGFKESKKNKPKKKESEKENAKTIANQVDAVEEHADPTMDKPTDLNANRIPDSEEEGDVLNDVGGGLNSYEIANNESRASNVINSVEEDAPFDEPVPFDEPGPTPSPRARKFSPQSSSFVPSQTQDDLAIPSESLRMEPITNRAHSDKSYEFTTRQRTFASQMTDTTKKIKNTKPKNFDVAQVNVDVNTSLDSSIASEVNTPVEEVSIGGGAGSQELGLMAKHDSDFHFIKDSRKDNSNVSGVAPSRNVSKPSEMVTKNAKDRLEEDEPTADDTYEDYDDWSDEVSELSGIGNDSDGMLGSNSGRKKLLIGRGNPSAKDGLQRDSRTEKSSQRDIPSDDVRNWTQEELDSFISKNDWGSVSKYIAEMRDNKQKNGTFRRQPSIEEIQAQMEHNRRLENNDGKPRKKFGAKSQIQHSAIKEEESSAESLWNSLSSTSYASSNEESSFADRPRKSTRQKHRERRTKMV